jgi:hypothetical protein
MDEGIIGIFVLIGISIGSALVSHWLIRSYFIASFCAAIVADIVFQVAAYLHFGSLDSFFLIAIVAAGGSAFAIAIAIGIPFVVIRRRRRDTHAANPLKQAI